MKNILKYLSWLPAAAWFAFIWQFSAQPATTSTETSSGFLFKLLSLLSPSFVSAPSAEQTALIETLSVFARKGAHMFLYFVLTLLLFLALWKLVRIVKLRPALSVALCAVFAAIDEYHQTFVPGRTGKVTDVLVDLVGALVAVGVVALVNSVIKRRKEK